MKLNVRMPPKYRDFFFNSDVKDMDFLIIRSGRDAGKSINGIIAAEINGLNFPSIEKIVMFRESKESLKESSYDACRSMIDLYKLPYEVKYNQFVSKTNGTRIIFEGLKKHTAHSIKSLADTRIAVIDEANYVSMEAWDYLIPTIRKQYSQIWAFWNPEDEDDPAEQLFNPNVAKMIYPRLKYMFTSFEDNIFLSDRSKRIIDFERKRNPKVWEWKYGGGYLPELEGAIFENDWFIENELNFNDFKHRKMIIASDPATSGEENANEFGIFSMGITEQDDLHLYEDASDNMFPNDWAMTMWRMAEDYKADAMVVEKNQGGDLLRTTLKNVKEIEKIKYECPIIMIHSKGQKHERARLMQPYYQNGRVRHNGKMMGLTKQLRKTTLTGYEGKGSPDRMDSITIGFNYLNKYIRNRLKAINLKYDGGFRPIRRL